MSGRRRLTCASRRSDAVPRLAPRGSFVKVTVIPRGYERVARILALEISGDH